MSFSVAFTGHRTLSGDLNGKVVREIIEDAIRRGADTFYCGMACGFDLFCCWILSRLRKYYTFKVVACIPCRNQEKNFSVEDKILYARMCEACDEVVILSEFYYNGCMQVRNRYMVDRADEVIAYLNDNRSGTGYTVRYAREKGKKVIFVC